MFIRRWLTVNQRGSTRITANKPTLNSDEITILMHFSIPDSLFEKPHLHAKITIPESAAAESIITEEIVESARDAVQQAIGMDLEVRVVHNIEEGD